MENRLCEDVKTSFALHDVERSEDLFFFFFRFYVISGGNLDDENCGPFKSLGTLLFIYYSAREGLGLPTCGPSAEIIAHPWSMVMCSCVSTTPMAKVTWKFRKSTLETHQECHHSEISNYLPVELVTLQSNQKSFDICIVFFKMHRVGKRDRWISVFILMQYAF